MGRNISVFDSDSLRHGGYVYTMVDRWSARAATLNRWFAKCGDSVVEQKFFSLVPNLGSTLVARPVKKLEPLLEAIPAARQLTCSTNLILCRRTTALP